MKTIALVAQKGGTGKSTMAMHLAVCAGREGKTVALIDLDPQATVTEWGEMRRERLRAAREQGASTEDDPLEDAVVAARAQELPGLLASAKKQGAHWAIVDTAGRMDVTSANAVELADVVLVPCRASFPDLKASIGTAEQIRKGRAKKAFFVLNAVPAQGLRQQEAREALRELLPVAPVELHHYVAYGDALNDGRSVEELEPNGKAATEIRALYAWLKKV
jgi:chromosome partitioning protein